MQDYLELSKIQTVHVNRGIMDIIIDHKQKCISYTLGNHKISTRASYDYLSYSSMNNSDSFYICSKKYDNERELVSITTMDIWNSYGVKTIFYPVSYNTKYDRIFGEDGNRYIDKCWSVMASFELPKENKTWGYFGIEGINDFSMFISKEHFNHQTDGYNPKIGDLILTPYNNKLYEIMDVKEDGPLFLLSKQYAWELIVRKAKVEKNISISSTLKNDPIFRIYNKNDMFDISTAVDMKKEDILYTPKDNEKPHNDPFGSW